MARYVGAAAVIAAASRRRCAAGPANAIAHGTSVPDGTYAFSTKLTMTNIPPQTASAQRGSAHRSLHSGLLRLDTASAMSTGVP
jgi:hypothetical protein